MRLLVLTSRRLESRQSGYDLRVANLCAHLPAPAHLVVAHLGPVDGGATGRRLPTEDLFVSVHELPTVVAGGSSLRRHLRLTQDRVLERTYPAPFARASDRLGEIVRDLAITHLIVFGGDVAELAATVEGVPIVLDVCDSTALTMRRALRDSPRPSRGLARWKDRLALIRATRTEQRYLRRFARVVAISEPDAHAVEGRRHGLRSVAVVPNGIDESFLATQQAPGSRRGVAFWGNLAFGPNRDALWFFIHDVWLPILRDAEVELCIIGANAPQWLVDIATEESSIVLLGYVDDLRPVVAQYPIMINPMRTGSGLKNKVLEAFGLGLVVVTTPRGVDAIPELTAGEHVLCAPDPAGFAAHVQALLDDRKLLEPIRTAARSLVDQHYRWEGNGERWSSLVAGVAAPSSNRARS